MLRGKHNEAQIITALLHRERIGSPLPLENRATRFEEDLRCSEPADASQCYSQRAADRWYG